MKKRLDNKDTIDPQANISESGPRLARLRRYILPPLAILIFLLIGTCALMLTLDRQQEVDEESSAAFERIPKVMKQDLKEHESMMTATLEVISNEPDLKKAFLARDRQKLLEITKPIFDTLQKNHDITHFYFHTPDHIAFLRLHKPNSFGNKINRLTALEAEKTGKTFAGLELGKYGTLTFRVVQPWFENGKLIGYIELGEEVESIVSNMGKNMGLDFIVLVNKNFLNHDHWLAGMKFLKRHLKWDSLKSYVILDQTSTEFPSSLVEKINNYTPKEELEYESFSADGHSYYMVMLPLMETGNRVVGRLVAFRNIDVEIAAFNRSIIKVALVCSIAGLAIFVFFYYFLKMIEKKLNKSAAIIQENQKTTDTLLNAPGNMAMLLKPDGTALAANKSVLKKVGLSSKEIIGTDILTLIDSSLAPQRKARLKEAARTGQPAQYEEKSDDSWLIHNIIPIVDSPGQTTRIAVYFSDITEQKQAKETLARSERRYRNVVESMSDWVWEVNADGIYTYVSENAQAVLGYTPEEILGKTPFDFIAPEELGRIQRHFREISKHNQPIRNLENWNLTKDGRRICLLTNGVPLFDDDGEVIGYRGVDSDITDRKLAEEALANEKQFTESALNNLQDIFYVVGPDGYLQRWNKKVNLITGYSDEKIKNTLAINFFHEDDRQKAQDAIEEALENCGKNDRGTKVEVRFRTKNGYVPYEMDGKWLTDQDGTPIAMCGTGRDVSERKQAQEKIAAAYQKLQSVMDASRQASIIATDLNGTITLFNRGSEEMFGYTAEEMVGKQNPGILHHQPEVIARGKELTQELGRTIEGFEIFTIKPLTEGSEQREWTFVKKDGSHVNVSLCVAPIRDHDNEITGFLGVALDITDRKKAEETLLAKTALLEAQVESTLDGLLIIDENGKTILMNQKMVDLWNLPRDVIESNDDKTLIQAVTSQLKHPKEFLEKIQYLYEHKHEKSRDEIEFLDGRTLDRYSSPIIDKNGKYIGRIWTFRDVTDRKKAEEDILKSETKFRSLFESTADAVMLFGRNANSFIDCNEATVKMFGYDSREDFCRNHPGSISPAKQPDGSDSIDLANEKMDIAIREGSCSFEWTHSRKDGTDFSAEVLASPLEIDGQTVIQGVVRDITERKRAERELRDSEKQLQTIVDSIEAGVIILDAETHEILSVNPRAASMIQRDVDDMIGKACHQFICPTWEGQCPATDLCEEINNAEKMLIKADGAKLHVLKTVKPVTLKGRECLLETFVDITDRKQAEEELKAEKNFTETSLNNLQDLFYVYGLDGRLLRWNIVAKQLSGLSDDELKNAYIFDFFEGEEKEEAIRSIDQIIAEGSIRLESTLQTVNGPVPYAFSTRLLTDADGNPMGMCGTGRDVSGLKEAEQNRKSALERQQKLNSLNQYLLGTSPLEDKLKKITDEVVEIFGADFARIWVTKPGDHCDSGCIHAKVAEGPHVCKYRDRCLHLMSSSGRYTHLDGEVHGRVPFGCYKIGLVASGEDSKFLTNDVTHNPRVHNHEWAEKLGLVSFAGYQLKPPSGKTMGVLALFSKNPISEEEDALLEALGNTTAQVIQAALSEEALAQSETKFRTLYDCSSDAVMIIDENGYTDCNDATLKVFGCASREQFLSKHPADFSPEKQPCGKNSMELAQEQMAKAFKDGSNFFEWIHCKLDKTEFYADVLLNAMEIGGKTFLQAVVRDKTEQKLAAEALRNSESMLRAILENVGIGIATISPEMKIMSLNKQMQNWFPDVDVSKHQICFECLHDPPKKGVCSYCPTIKTFKDGQIHEAVTEHEDKDQIRHYRVIASPIKDDEGNVTTVVEIVDDITEQKRDEERIRRAKEELEQTNKTLEEAIARAKAFAKRAAQADMAKSEFLANMSHEIRTPMTAILGFTDQLKNPDLSAEQRSEYLAIIGRNGRHLLDLINDILDISKIDADKLEIERLTCRLDSVAADVASLMRIKTQEKGIGLSVKYQGAIPETIITDPTRLRQILVNLTGNAVKFTEKGGIDIIVKFLPKWRTKKPAIQIRIADTGIGMSEETLNEIFSPFRQGDSTTSRKYGGTGLGLAISFNLAKLMGGELTVESTLGKGSTFILTLPTGNIKGVKMLTEPSEAIKGIMESSDAEKISDTKPLEGLKILLAEDGMDNQLLIGTILKNAGAKVDIVSNGRLAVEAVLKPTTYDLILMDIQMPEMDGYEATKKLRDNRVDCPIIALTAHAMTQDREKCLKVGCSDYCAKPVDRAHLITTIARHTGRNHGSKQDKQQTKTQPAEAKTLEPIPSQFENDPDIKDILDNFVAGLQEKVQAMQEATSNNHFSLLQRLAHQMKGAGGGYGYPLLTEKAAILEEAAKKQDIEEAKLLLVEFSNLCKAIEAGHKSEKTKEGSKV